MLPLAKILALVAILSMATGIAWATPGSLAWFKDGSTTQTKYVARGQTVSMTFTDADSTGASMEIRIEAERADFCFLPDSLAATGPARLTLYRRLASPATDSARITLPAVTTTGLDCDVIVMGTYWFEITVAAAASDVALVTITGR